MAKTLTVFTPAYNRAHTLPKLYDSLKAQSCKDFAWLVVDDGSTDVTAELLQGYMAENILDMRVISGPNLGKYRAHNRAAQLADTQLFVCVDSDDYLKPNAVEFIVEMHAQNRDKGYLAYVSRRGFLDGSLNGNDRFYAVPTVAQLNDLYVKNGFSGDTMMVFAADKLKRFAFPEFEGERFATENILYYQMQNAGDVLFLPDCVYLGEYMEDGLTRNVHSLYKKNPRSQVYYAKLRAAVSFLPFTQRVRSGAHFYAARRVFKAQKDMDFKEITIPAGVKLFAFLLSPFIYRRIKRLYTE